MLCKKAYRKGIHQFGCQQCGPCRQNRNRVWAHRMVLESFKHPKSSFVTLTYNDEHYPPGGSLVPRDLRLFIMRLRSRVRPTRVRFYACGEYGAGAQERPHYHIAFFGLGREDQAIIEKAWHSPESKLPIGFVHVGDLNFDSAQYIAKYIQKGYNKPDDARLKGRHKEFARMSNRPGLGALAIPDIAEGLNNDAGMHIISTLGDVPGALSHGRRSMPLGRYLKSKLRHEMGLDEDKIKSEKNYQKTLQMSQLLEEAQSITCPKAKAEHIHKWSQTAQQVRNIEAKINIFKKGGIL